MPNPTLKMDSVTVLDKDSDGVHFKNSLIHSSITGQNRPYFFCSEHSTNPSIGSTETELTAWTEGTNGDPDSKFDTSTGRFTPGVAGIYLFGAKIFNMKVSTTMAVAASRLRYTRSAKDF